MAHLVATKTLPNGKAILLAQNDLTIDHLEFSGASVPSPDLNGAGIRYEGGNLKVTNSYFHDNQMNIMGGVVAGGTVVIDHTEFGYTTPSATILSHSLYIGHIASLTVTNSYFHDTSNGHHIKSRADYTDIENNRIVDGNGTSSYSIDMPNGGKGVVLNNVIEQGPHQSNPAIIHFGGESAPYAGSSLLVKGNTILNDYSGSGTAVLNHATTVTAEISGNKLWHVPTLFSGPGHDGGGNSVLSSEPAIDTSHPWTTTTPTPTPTPTVTELYGTSGADTLSGAGGDIAMYGGYGNDTYIVDSAGDKVTEYSGQGVDTVKSSLSFTLGSYTEKLVLTGSNAINGSGLGGKNTIVGNDAANVLTGGKGADVLTGGGGADTFRYLSPGDGLAIGTNVTKGTKVADTITDFKPDTDKVLLDDYNFKMAAGSAVEGVTLVHLTTAYNGTNATGATQFTKGLPALVIDSTNTLYYDANGKGDGYTVLATFQPGINVHASDIVIA
ncbi:MAG: calcium-binding protein [Magnetospirillum sp.]|nr:MAG: calcium-binding protein [Magnetospirillum sp.]